MLRFYNRSRFTRRNVDPAPLAAHGLMNELLNRLSDAATPMQSANSTVTGTIFLFEGLGTVTDDLSLEQTLDRRNSRNFEELMKEISRGLW